MKEFVLNYYQKFKCAGKDCKHSCCVGWDMYIDQESLKAYKNESSIFGKRLKKGIDFKRSKFKSDKSGRCAFLNGDGLCEIIINLGEQSLCQICNDHPRFKSFFEDRIETGLGFCCERATEIILSCQERIEPVLVSECESDNNNSFIQEQILKFRQSAVEIIQDRSLDINERIQNLLLLCRASVTNDDCKKIIKTFLSCERLNKDWGVKLGKLKKEPFSLIVCKEHALYCEQFLVNSLYRHLCDAEDTLWVRARTLALIFAWFIIENLAKKSDRQKDDFYNICNIVREFSTEVEYSTKNTNKLFKFAYGFIEI